MAVLRVPKAFWRILSAPPSSSLTCPECTGPAFSADLACQCLLIRVTARSAVLRRHLWLIIPGSVSKNAMNIGQWTRAGNGSMTWGSMMWGLALHGIILTWRWAFSYKPVLNTCATHNCGFRWLGSLQSTDPFFLLGIVGWRGKVAHCVNHCSLKS